MTEIHARRLLRLAAFLDTVSPRHFDMDKWGYPEEPRACGKKAGPACGTVACVGGWAGSMPEFRALGLHLIPGNFPGAYGEVVYYPSNRTDRRNLRDYLDEHELVADQLNGSKGLAVFFGLSDDEREDIFFSTGYEARQVTPKMAARKIRSVVTAHFPTGVSIEGPLS